MMKKRRKKRKKKKLWTREGWFYYSYFFFLFFFFYFSFILLFGFFEAGGDSGTSVSAITGEGFVGLVEESGGGERERERDRVGETELEIDDDEYELRIVDLAWEVGGIRISRGFPVRTCMYSVQPSSLVPVILGAATASNRLLAPGGCDGAKMGANYFTTKAGLYSFRVQLSSGSAASKNGKRGGGMFCVVLCCHFYLRTVEDTGMI
jgi:hypothetical protein